jgi:hypothetical protein
MNVINMKMDANNLAARLPMWNTKRYVRMIVIIPITHIIARTRLFVTLVLWKIGYIMDKYISTFKATNVVKDMATKNSTIIFFTVLPKQSSMP